MSFELPGRPAWAAVLLILAIIIAIGACSHEKTSDFPATYALLSDPAALDNALARCNQSSASVEEQECRNVRAALARLADERRKDSGEIARQAQAQAQAQIQFEQQRQALRQQQEAERARKALEREKAAVDPYTMPFVPPESPSKAQPKPDSAPAPTSTPMPAPAPAPAQQPDDPGADATATKVVASDLELSRQ